MDLRIGFGYDIHKLSEGGRLVIGGVIVSEDLHAVAHSDGDVLCHAIIDALLGAANLQDIGAIFPETEENRGMSSIEALKGVFEMIERAGYEVINVDSTVVFSRFKLSKFREDIENALSNSLRCPVSVKFKSGNGVGEIGEGRAIQAFATALLVKR